MGTHDEEKSSLNYADVTSATQIELLKEVHEAICSGAEAFLKAEYTYCIIFEFFFAIVVFILISLGQNVVLGGLTTLAFVLGASTSILSGYIGMKGQHSFKLRSYSIYF